MYGTLSTLSGMSLWFFLVVAAFTGIGLLVTLCGYLIMGLLL